MICDTLEHLGRYKGLHPNLDTAIDYLLAHDLSALPDGRTEVDGDEVFINVMDADLNPHTGSHAEYHRLQTFPVGYRKLAIFQFFCSHFFQSDIKS